MRTALKWCASIILSAMLVGLGDVAIRSTLALAGKVGKNETSIEVVKAKLDIIIDNQRTIIGRLGK